MKSAVLGLSLILLSGGAAYSQELSTRERLVALEGTLNTRDIGGYRTSEGRKVAWGRLFRSSELSYLTDADIRMLQDRHVSAVVDFRGPKEAADAPDRVPPATGQISSPVIGDRLDMDAVHRFLQKDGFPDGMYDEAKVSAYGPFYRMLTLVNSYDDPNYVDKLGGYKPFFKQLLDQPADTAVLFHCTGGRDRTGVATALLLFALGVPQSTIEADYTASNDYLQPERDNPDSVAFDKFRFSSVYLQPVTNRRFQEVAKSFGTSAERIRDAIRLKPEYLQSLFDNVKRRYGSIENFMSAELGLGPQEIERLRQKYTIADQ